MKTLSTEQEALAIMRHHKTPSARWGYTYYHPLTPGADTEELAMLGRRVMLFHGSHTFPDTSIEIVPQGVVTAGWVIGIVP